MRLICFVVVRCLACNRANVLDEVQLTRGEWAVDPKEVRIFIHSFVHPFFHQFIHPFVHSSIHQFIRPFIHLLIHSFIRSYIHSFINSFIHSFICSFSCSDLLLMLGAYKCIPAYLATCIHMHACTHAYMYSSWSTKGWEPRDWVFI